MPSKRFFCTVCNKVKRVRQLPTRIKSSESSVPDNRIGVCNRHSFIFASKAEERRYNMLKGIK